MKLTVSRLVHAYRVGDRGDGMRKDGPYAAVVVGVGGGGAGLRILHPTDTDLDCTKFVNPTENDPLYTTDNEGWLWCWPPRE